MREHLDKRLSELRTEFQSGERLMQELDERRAKLRDSLLRISGAITVLEEELGRAAPATPPRPAGEG